MEWQDEGLIIGVRRHGETSVIAEIFTREHGRHLGIVRGGRGKRMQPLLQPGNSVSIVWRARLEEHLGMYTVEALKLRADSRAGLVDRLRKIVALEAGMVTAEVAVDAPAPWEDAPTPAATMTALAWITVPFDVVSCQKPPASGSSPLTCSPK